MMTDFQVSVVHFAQYFDLFVFFVVILRVVISAICLIGSKELREKEFCFCVEIWVEGGQREIKKNKIKIKF